MNNRKIPINFSNFNNDRAIELLKLTQEAHKRYDKAKKDPKWLWEKDLPVIEVNGAEYQILTNLGFAHYNWLRRRRVPFGFIAKHQTTQDIYVVFRGTSNTPEWISNFKLIQESYEQAKNPPLCPTIPHQKLGRLHRGFYQTYTRPDLGGLIDWVYDFTPHQNYESMRDRVESFLRQHASSDTRVFVTGHSLGGAISRVRLALRDRNIMCVSYSPKPNNSG